jgi:hypothetical protein
MYRTSVKDSKSIIAYSRSMKFGERGQVTIPKEIAPRKLDL